MLKTDLPALGEYERIDDTGFGGLKIIQDRRLFCYGVDAVLLADFCCAKKNDKVLDMGCGNGAVSFICHAKYEPERITGIDIQKESCGLARRSAVLNGLEDRITFIEADILDAPRLFGRPSFTLIVCNPPYFEKGGNIISSTDPLSLARHESSADLESFFRVASDLLEKRGRLCMIHRPDRLADLMEYPRKYSMEPKRIRFVSPKPGEPANMVLIEYVKGGGKELRLLPQLYVRDADGSYSRELDRIYERQ